MDQTNPDSTECISLFGERLSIPTSRLFFRPCVYNETTSKFSFPGGGVNLGEPLHKALHREVYEEVGINIEVKEFLHFEEAFFYYDPTDEAMHTLGFFFRCLPMTLELDVEKVVDDGETLTSEWVGVMTLLPGDFQGTTGNVVPLLQAKWTKQ